MMLRVVLALLAFQCASALYSANGDVTIITKKNFAREVIASDLPYVVEFFAPWCGHCKSLAPVYKDVAKKVKGLAGVGAIDCDQEKELCGTFGIKGFPTLKIFPAKRGKKEGHPWKEPSDYNGARSVGAISNAVLAALDDTNIRQMTKLDAKAIEKLFPQGKKSVLLFSAKSEPSNLFKALSMRYTSRGLSFVTVIEKGNEEIAKTQFGVQKFPALLVVNGGSGDTPHVTYSGKLNAGELSEFLEKYATPVANDKQQKDSKSEPTPTPKPVEYDQKMEEVSDASIWERKCASKTGLCGVAFLDPLEDEARHAKFVGVLEDVLKRSYKNVRVMWVDGPKHFKFFERFNLGGGMPNFALYSPSKKRVIPYRGSFTTDDINEWIDRVLMGGATTSSTVDVLSFE